GALVSLGCGSNFSAPPSPVSPDPPTSGSLTLTSFGNPVPAGSSGFQNIATGTGFTPKMGVFWNGSALSTSYQTNEILYANVPTSFLAKPGTASVLVKDTSTGAVSNT